MKLPRNIIIEEVIFPRDAYYSALSRPFLAAVKRNDVMKVVDMITTQERYLVFEFDECRQTGLIWAAKRNHTDMVRILCRLHSRVNF